MNYMYIYTCMNVLHSLSEVNPGSAVAQHWPAAKNFSFEL